MRRRSAGAMASIVWDSRKYQGEVTGALMSRGMSDRAAVCSTFVERMWVRRTCSKLLEAVAWVGRRLLLVLREGVSGVAFTAFT